MTTWMYNLQCEQDEMRNDLTSMEHQEAMLMCKTTQLTYIESGKILINNRSINSKESLGSIDAEKSFGHSHEISTKPKPKPIPPTRVE